MRGWAATAIADPAAGLGILNSDLYVGRYVWNRCARVKDSDTGHRERTLRRR